VHTVAAIISCHKLSDLKEIRRIKTGKHIFYFTFVLQYDKFIVGCIYALIMKIFEKEKQDEKSYKFMPYSCNDDEFCRLRRK